MTRRRWIADSWSENTAALKGEQAAHLARVLRAAPGMEFDVVTGSRVWRAIIRAVADDSVTFELLQQIEADAALPFTLLLSVFKFDRMEWAIEKATELGVAGILPVLARHTEKHLALAAGKRVERWRRLALEAAKQSRRTGVPAIQEPAPLRDALSSLFGGPSYANTLRLLLAENEKQTLLSSALVPLAQEGAAAPRELALAIGPEGGWAPDELALFAEHQWQPVSLGPRILRTETAAIAAVAICGSAWLDAQRTSPAQEKGRDL